MSDIDRHKLGKRSRRKGANGELEASKAWNKLFPKAASYRTRQRHGSVNSPDIDSEIMDWLHVEVKRVERFALYAALEQAKRDSKGMRLPLVLHRMNNKPWVAVVELNRLSELVTQLYPYLQECTEDVGAIGEDTDAVSESST